MSRIKFVYKQKIIKISLPQQLNLNELMATGRFVSESEIFREGLEMVYRKVSPPYLRPSVSEEVKKEKMDKEKAYDAQSDLEFVEQTLEDVHIYTDSKGQMWVLFIKLGNHFGAVKLNRVKEWVKNDPEFNYHKQTAGTDHTPYPEIFTDPSNKALRDNLRNQYGVAIAEPEEEVPVV